MKSIFTFFLSLLFTTFWAQEKTPTFNQVNVTCSGDYVAPLPTISLEGITGTWSPEIHNFGEFIYTFTPNPGQRAAVTYMQVIIPSPTIPNFAEVATICAGDYLYELPTVSNEGISGYWEPAINNQETTTYTFIPNEGQCAGMTNLTITVNPRLLPTFSEIDPICVGTNLAPLPTTSFEGIAGTWSPAINNYSTTTYTFTPNPGQCAQSTQFTIIVNPLMTPTFIEIAPVCSENNVNVLSNVSLDGIYGTWSPEFDSKNTTVYTFTPDEGQCSATTTVKVDVIQSDIPLFSDVQSVCSGEFLNELPNTSDNGISGSWSPEIDNTVTTTYTFTPDVGQCAAVATLTIIIDPKLPTFKEIKPICSGDPLNDFSTTSDEGYVGSWSPNKVDNTVTATYTFTPNEGQCASPVSVTIIVNQYEADFSDLTICSDMSINDLPSQSSNGVSGTWKKNGNSFIFTPSSGQCAKNPVVVNILSPITPEFDDISPIEAGAIMDDLLPALSLNGIGGIWSPELNNQETTTYTFTPNPGQCAISTQLTIEVAAQRFNSLPSENGVFTEDSGLINVVTLAASPTGNSPEVGTTNGEVSVAPSGAGTYTMPIAVPPGLNGVTPQIGLTYNSQSGNGIAGYGWNISGLSAISRIPSTVFHDNISDPVDFDTYDRFALDGQRLMLKTGNYGSPNSTYETENFSNTRITYTGSSFKVEYSDGATAYYGTTPDSNGDVIFHLNYWENMQGIRITYNYTKSGYICYINTITYGSKGTATPINEIKFIYTERLREEQYYIYGLNFKDNKILSSINIKGNNVPYRNYNLSYDLALKYHRLKSITEKNGNSSKSYNPTTFEYENESFSTNIVRSTTPSFVSDTSWVYDSEIFAPEGFMYFVKGGMRFYQKHVVNGDFDGDGEQDFIYKNKLYTKVSDTGSSPTVIDFSNLLDQSQTTIFRFPIRTLLEKTDGNYQILNRDTWCLESRSGFVPNSPTYTFTYDIYAKSENENNVTLLYSKEISIESEYPEEFTGDFNGDGITDRLLLKTHGTNWEAYFVNLDPRISSNYTKNLGDISTISTKADGIHLYISDMNGDGKSDIVVFQGKKNKIVVYSLDNDDNLITLWETPINFIQNSNTIFFEKVLVHSYIDPQSSLWINLYDRYSYDPIFGDLNGDGNTDILLRGLDRKVLMSTGLGLISEALPNTFPPSRESNNYLPIDFDNDGETNIVAFRKTGNNAWTVNNLFRTSKSTWASLSNNFSNSDPSNCSSTITDIQPFMVKTSKEHPDRPQIVTIEFQYNTPCLMEFKVGFYTNMNTLSINKSLQKITYGNGIKDYIYYSQLIPGSSIYKSAGQTENYPNYDIGGNTTLRAVDHISKEVTPGSFKYQFYRYMGATGNSEGIGFLGFRTVVKTNWFSDMSKAISTVTLNDMSLRGAPSVSFSVDGLASPDKVLLPNEPFISKSLYSYNNNLSENPLQSNKVFKLRNTFTQNFNGLDGTISDITSTYDTYNVKKIKTVLRGSNSPESKSVEAIYDYDNLTASPYLIGRPKSKITTAKLGNDTSVSEELYTFSGNLLTEARKRSTNSGITTDYLTETNGYDGYGNTILKTISSPGMADRISSFQYDPQTHRFLSKKIDVLGLESSYTYNLSTGQVLSEITPSIPGFQIKTGYTYDTWGKLTNATNYLGSTPVLSVTTTYKNIAEGMQSVVSGNDGSESKIILDYSGRKIHELVKNINNIWSCVSTQYDSNNQPLKISQPYFIDGNNLGNFTVWNEMQYDRYGRTIQSNALKSASSNGNQTTYNYSGLSMTENDGQKQKTTITNNYGSIAEISEAGGESINFKYFANGNLKSTDTGGAQTVIEQDGFGRKITLTDPSAGIYRYTYNNFGELKSEEIENKGITQYTLDNYGRVTEKTITGYGDDTTNSTIKYGYNAYGLSNSVLLIDDANDYRISYSYEYDNFLRLKNKKEVRNSSVNSMKFFDFQREYLYDGFSRADREKFYAKDVRTGKLLEKWIKTTYKNGYQYQLYDMLSSTAVGTIKLWQTDLTSPQGNIATATLGNGVNIFNVNNNYGIPQMAMHYKGSASIMYLTTAFTASTANLKQRKYSMPNLTWTENLSYDSFDRLTTYKNKTGYQVQSYNNNGTISSNNIGSYEYNIQGQPYNQTSVATSDPSTINYYSAHRQDIAYNVFNSPISISEEGIERINFEYNPFNQRAVMYYGDLEKNKTDRTMRKFYSDDGTMEIRRRTLSGSSINDFTFYIGGDGYTAPVILRGTGSSKEYYYLHRDYQGSIMAITGSAGNIVEKRMYDVWGALVGYGGTTTTIPTTSTGLFLDRGYTGHEHLLGVGLINMNGRIYDPKLHRFLQPDNNVQDPTNPQNFNRFGYCMNNPTKYSDPSGEFWGFVAGFIFSAYVHGAQATGEANPLKWNAGQYLNALAAPTSQVLSLGVTNFGNAYVDNYNKESMLVGTTVGSIPVDYSFIKVNYSWNQLKNDYLHMMRSADNWADGEGGQEFGEFVAGTIPIISGVNAYLGASEGKDMYGHDMGKGDTALAVASIIPYGRFAKYLNIKKGIGLADDIAKTFRFGQYEKIVLEEAMTLSRYYDDVNAFAKGRWMTNSLSKFKFMDRITLALRPSWNKMTNVAHWNIPAGTTVYKGKAAMQFPWIGGKTQYYIDFENLANATQVGK